MTVYPLMKAEIFHINTGKPDHRETTDTLCRALREGSVIAYPTETFYGLGASILCEKAIERIFVIKGREKGKPLPVIIPGPDSLHDLCSEIPGIALALMDKFWPGGLTLIFRASKVVSPLITGGSSKIGVRVSSNPIAQEIVSTLGTPIIATSANITGEPGCTTAQEVLERLGTRIDYIVDGGRTEGMEASTVLDLTLTPPRIVREGVVREENLNPILSP